MGNKQIKNHWIGLFVAVLLFPAAGFAGDLSVHSRTLTQVKKARNKAYRIPISEYFDLNLSNLPKNSTFDLNFQGSGEPKTSYDRFDLYLATFHIEPTSSLYIDGGRFWLPDGFGVSLMDGGRFSLMPKGWKVGFGAYAGIPRYLDDGEFEASIIEGFATGFQLLLQDVTDTAAALSFQYRKADVTQKNYRENDIFLAGLSTSHQFSDFWATPQAYGNFEYNVPGKMVNAGAVGGDFYPHWRVAFNLEGGYYDVDRRYAETSFLGQYFSGAMYQGQQGMEIKLGKGFRYFENVSIQKFKVTGRGNENGYLISDGLGYYWEPIKLSTTLEGHYAKSFGGKVYGGLIEWTSKYFKNLLMEASLDVSRYNKVTGQKDTAVSIVGALGVPISKHFDLKVGGEYGHNNWFNNEGRVTLQIDMNLDNSQSKKRHASGLLEKSHEI